MLLRRKGMGKGIDLPLVRPANKAAEVRGTEMLAGEPRAATARYDATSGRIVVDLTNGCTFAFPTQRIEEFI